MDERDYKAMNEQLQKEEYYQNPPQHNEIACEAYKQFNKDYDEIDAKMYEQIIDRRGNKINGRRLNTPKINYIPISDYARKYGTTVKEMKQHWRCIEDN